MSNRMGRLKVPNKKRCMLCKNVMHNPFRKQPWCEECALELQEKSYNGEELLNIVLRIMPPTPPVPEATIRAWTVLKIARRVLQDEGIIPEDDESDDVNKSPLILS